MRRTTQRSDRGRSRRDPAHLPPSWTLRTLWRSEATQFSPLIGVRVARAASIWAVDGVPGACVRAPFRRAASPGRPSRRWSGPRPGLRGTRPGHRSARRLAASGRSHARRRIARAPSREIPSSSVGLSPRLPVPDEMAPVRGGRPKPARPVEAEFSCIASIRARIVLISS